jgi:chaperonin GroEL
VRRALRAPARQIAENAGEDGAYIVGKLLESEDYNRGFNAVTGTYEDLAKSGAIDPAKVVRTALQDAASIASLPITSEALVVELPKHEKHVSSPSIKF